MGLFGKVPEGEMIENKYTISYAKHCVRMSGVYKWGSMWKGLCIGSNLIWIISYVFSLVAR